MWNRRYARIIYSSIIFSVTLWTFYLHSAGRLTSDLALTFPSLGTAPEPVSALLPEDACKLEPSTLEPYKLSTTFQYARRYISVAKSTDKPLHSVENLDELLVPASQTVKAASGGPVTLSHCHKSPLNLTVQFEDLKTNASEMIFSVATTAERLKDSVAQMQYWLGDSGATLMAVVPKSPVLSEVEKKMSEAGIDFKSETSSAPFTTRYLSLIQHLYKEVQTRPANSIRWVSIIDDDTFFPSLTRLLARLNSYDPERPHYVGAISEDLHQIAKHGYFAFGGAGIFLSVGLLRELAEDFDTCAELAKPIYDGDVKLATCIFQMTTTKLTVEPDLHQMDLFGGEKVSGVFESGRQFLSFHHWKSWYKLDIMSLTAVADICGQACLLQRWKFPLNPKTLASSFHLPSNSYTGKSNPNAQGATVLTNGYSIVRYPPDFPLPDLSKTEKTWAKNPDFRGQDRSWNKEASDFAHSLAPLRPSLEEGREKFTFRMAGAFEAQGSVRQTYVKRGAVRKDEDGKEVKDDDEVIELIWLE